jgi:hypothetical protein
MTIVPAIPLCGPARGLTSCICQVTNTTVTRTVALPANQKVVRMATEGLLVTPDLTDVGPPDLETSRQKQDRPRDPN